MGGPVLSAGESDRGQAQVIGAVLIFGVLIALLALLQVSAVPGWNQALEIQHSERVQEDVQAVTVDLREVAATGQTRTEMVELGLQYPPRPFFFNPPDPDGTLRTTAPRFFAVSNVDIAGVDNYWNGGPDAGVIDGQTRSIVYEPDYNEYRTPPITRYENGLLYNQFERVLPLASPGFLDGRRITLIAINGSYNRTATRSTSVSISPESAPSSPVSITNDTAGPVVLSLPTALPEGEWEDRLEPEYVSNGGHILDDATGVSVSDGHLNVTLEPGVDYQLEMARVRVGPNGTRTRPRYVTALAGGETPLRPNQAERLSFGVRDKFNNPVGGVPVTVDATGGTLSTHAVSTGVDGTVQVRYTAPPSQGTETVTASIDANDDGDRVDVGERTSVTIGVTNGTTEGDDFASVNPGLNSGRVMLVNATVNAVQGADLHFDNEGSSELTLTHVRLSYYYSDDTNPAPNTGVYEYGADDTTLSIPSSFVAVQGPTLAPNGQAGERDTVVLRDLKNNVKDDFMVLNTVWVDPTGTGHTMSYIFAAE